MPNYVVSKDGKRIGKIYSTKLQCIIEAFEKHLIWTGATDFGGDKFDRAFIEDIEILEVDNYDRIK